MAKGLSPPFRHDLDRQAAVEIGAVFPILEFGLGPGQGLLVAEDDRGGVVLDAAECYEAAALQFRGRARRAKALGIEVKRGKGILPQDALLPPIAV